MSIASTVRFHNVTAQPRPGTASDAYSVSCMLGAQSAFGDNPDPAATCCLGKLGSALGAPVSGPDKADICALQLHNGRPARTTYPLPTDMFTTQHSPLERLTGRTY